MTPNSVNEFINPYNMNDKSELPQRNYDFRQPDNKNRFNPSTDEDVDDFNYYDEYFDKIPTEHNDLNPLYKNESNFSDYSQEVLETSDQVGNEPLTNSLHAIDIPRMRTLPCIAALMGSCTKSPCYYSHDKTFLQETFDKRQAQLAASPFANKNRLVNNPIIKHNSSYTTGRSLGEQRRVSSASPAPFTTPRHLPSKSLYEIEDIPLIEEGDRVHRSGLRFASSSPLPRSNPQVSLDDRSIEV